MSRTLFIPVSILDGFFEDPEEVREYADTLEYTASAGEWPGSRTNNLYELNPTLFTNISNTFLALFSESIPISYEANIVFQKIGKDFGEGWVHQDSDTLTGIIYLNKGKEPCSNYGTSFYELKKTTSDIMPRLSELQTLKIKHNLEGGFKEYNRVTLENNSLYKKTIDVGGVFNRLVAFDSNILHAANNYDGGLTEDRLTLALFFKNIKFDVGGLPVPRAHSQILNYPR